MTEQQKQSKALLRQLKPHHNIPQNASSQMTIQQIIKPAFLTTEHRHVHLKQTKIYPHHSPHRHHRTDLWRPLGLVLLGLGRCHWSTGTSASHRDERATTNAMGEKWV